LLRVTPAAQDLIMRPADFYTNGADIINDLLVYRCASNLRIPSTLEVVRSVVDMHLAVHFRLD